MWREPARFAVIVLNLYSAYTIFTCPCDVLAECKQTEFYTTSIAPILIVYAMNVFKVK